MEGFLFQSTSYLAAAVIAVPSAARRGRGSVLGYLTAGIVIGPILGLVGSESEDLRHFAEFGVVMILFLIGLELEPRALWDMRHRLLGLGGAQIVITMLAVMGGAMTLGMPWNEGLAIGMIFALSSTAIVLQTLSEKGLMQTQGGRSAFSVLLTQDIAVIPMLIGLPLLTIGRVVFTPESEAHESIGDAVGPTAEGMHKVAVTFIAELPGWGAALVTLGAVGLVIVMGLYAFPPVFRFINGARLRELHTAFALLIVVSIAFLMSLVGLSAALGTFLAGVVLANSEFRHELESDLEPFKGLLLGLFFITVGAGINFQVIFDQPLTIFGLTLTIMLLKGVVLFALGLIFRLRSRNLWLFTLGLAQAGEFGFVLVSFSVQQDVLPFRMGEILLVTIALSMLLTPLFFILYEHLSKRMTEAGDITPDDEISEQGPVIIAGIGRFGQVVNRLVQMSGFPTTVVDHDLKTIQLMRKFGFKGYFGDPTRPELLHAAGLDEAKVLVVALDDRDATIKLVSYARKTRPDLHIVARAFDRLHVFQLYAAGANDIVREMFDSSLRAGRYVLENMGLSEYEAASAEETFFHMDRSALRELARLWDPKMPISENQAYLTKARELDKELETALLAQLEDVKKTDPEGRAARQRK
ncbi:MAG: cation:proton antiporter [Paracoccaceae bacterium]